MNHCQKCGKENKENVPFCSECGNLIESKDVQKRSQQPRKIKRTGVFVGVAVLLVIVVGAYQLLKQNYSEAVVKADFLEALNQKDETVLKELIVPSNSRMKVSRDSLHALFELLDQNPSMFEEIQDSLSNDSLTNGLFTIHQKGKVFGIFPRHVIEPSGYLVEVTAVGENTMIMLNDQELGYLEKSGDTSEFGPFLPGIYTLKTVTMLGTEKVEEEVKMTLSGAQMKKELTFTKAEESIKQQELAIVKKKEDEEKTKAEEKTQAEEKKKAEEKASEKVVIKEVIREVPVGGYYNYFLIPYSDYIYLSKSDLSGLTKSELRIARNEIFARYGFIFKSTDLQNYFNAQSWYYPNPTYKGELSELEQYNVDFIKSFE